MDSNKTKPTKHADLDREFETPRAGWTWFFAALVAFTIINLLNILPK